MALVDRVVFVTLDIADVGVRDRSVGVLLLLHVAVCASVARPVEVVIGYVRIASLRYGTEVGAVPCASTRSAPALARKKALIALHARAVGIVILTFSSAHFPHPFKVYIAISRMNGRRIFLPSGYYNLTHKTNQYCCYKVN